jgi:hypothetical protein
LQLSLSTSRFVGSHGGIQAPTIEAHYTSQPIHS